MNHDNCLGNGYNTGSCNYQEDYATGAGYNTGWGDGWDCVFAFAYGHHNGGGLGSGLGWDDEVYGEYPSNDFGFALLVCSDPLWLICMGVVK